MYGNIFVYTGGIISNFKSDIIGLLMTFIVSTEDSILSHGEKNEVEYTLDHQIIFDCILLNV